MPDLATTVLWLSKNLMMAFIISKICCETGNKEICCTVFVLKNNLSLLDVLETRCVTQVDLRKGRSTTAAVPNLEVTGNSLTFVQMSRSLAVKQRNKQKSTTTAWRPANTEDHSHQKIFTEELGRSFIMDSPRKTWTWSTQTLQEEPKHVLAGDWWLFHNQPRQMYSSIGRLCTLFSRNICQISALPPCSNDVYSPCHLTLGNKYSGRGMTDHLLYASGEHWTC